MQIFFSQEIMTVWKLYKFCSQQFWDVFLTELLIPEQPKKKITVGTFEVFKIKNE